MGKANRHPHQTQSIEIFNTCIVYTANIGIFFDIPTIILVKNVILFNFKYSNVHEGCEIKSYIDCTPK